MSISKCPKGHESTESDFCSECGAKILGIPELVLAENVIRLTVSQTKVAENCPDCSTPREPDSGDFCEICGYNFVSGGRGEVPILKTKEAEEQNTQDKKTEIPDSQSPTPTCPERSRSRSVSQRRDAQSPIVAWEVIITIDPSLRSPESPEPPINQRAIAFPLEKPNNLIGRNSQVRAIHPEIALDFDDAVSHRHALLNRQTDGTFTLRDIGSSNGTQFKGVELKPMVDIPLQDGDEFTLGHWTRIAVKIIRNS
ncbi:MAG: FHA domain-containing protein [Nostoc sp.]|uniref:FHA domain-containing protein n=1 Tax=Nostoc sp. TaxID=1180 RepID=UPI002FF6AADA